MRLLIVSGSQRKRSQSAKVAGYLAEKMEGFDQVDHIELCQYQLPFWDGDTLTGKDAEIWDSLRQRSQQSDALILITPEWGGMASPLIRNFLLMSSLEDTAHKPVMLVSVVSGINGAYPIAELRMNALKNLKLVPVPDHLIVRNVGECLNGNEVNGKRDQQLRQRIDYHLHMLHQYAQALLPLRHSYQHSPHPQQADFAYGM
ncbi:MULTISPECIES: NADPH-dependent FMN reductase [Corallincola]|uniref:NADPH-dependent oxidoreductase n=2 Tax=Corallincola TaxID=1775176 RepID=A0ABY1WTG5_9GAMM|nr:MULTISPECIES: NAD(P)H-dependent oxidoreductase [Corallincola]TAA47812.1 NADPH-dependent oxidoreductase [Corallincola spongiicola]TCI02045.1 NADPH-dependent oxidoreductase [Corallincola luteus]